MTVRIGLLVIVLSLLVGASGAAAQQVTPAPPGPTLNSVLSQGEVRCGVNQALPGFGFLDPNTGDIRGFEVDLCRALATAIFGSPLAINLSLYTNPNAGLRALQERGIDVLLRATPWTLSLDSTPGLSAGVPYFYNGLSFIVRAESSLNDWLDLDGVTICLTGDERTQLNLEAALALRGLSYVPVVTETADQAATAFVEGRCDAYTNDRVSLAVFQAGADNPAGYRLWSQPAQVYTREPFVPVFRSGDDQWAKLINWVMMGLVQAEALGITSESVNTLLLQSGESDAQYSERVGADVITFLNSRQGIGSRLGLPNDFMVGVIAQVGNYSEIYNRHLGPTGDVPLERSLNRLWRDGGLLFTPEWR